MNSKQFFSSFLLHGIGPEACFDFTYTFHLFHSLPQSWYPFGLYFRISSVFYHLSFYSDSLTNFVLYILFCIDYIFGAAVAQSV
jgi:hypothetical protein